MLNQIDSGPDLESEIWTIEEVAAFFKVTEKTARRYVSIPGFPKPIGGLKRNRKWSAPAVKAYAHGEHASYAAGIPSRRARRIHPYEVHFTPARSA